MTKTAWWGTRDNVSLRLQAEVGAMRHVFLDTFKLVVPIFGDQIYWWGAVTLNMQGISKRDHNLKILYPDNFPTSPPHVFVILPRVQYPSYQYPDGHLSLYDPRQGTKYGWNPAQSSAATMAAWGVQWLYSYYVWKLKGKWPDVIGGE